MHIQTFMCMTWYGVGQCRSKYGNAECDFYSIPFKKSVIPTIPVAIYIYNCFCTIIEHIMWCRTMLNKSICDERNIYEIGRGKEEERKRVHTVKLTEICIVNIWIYAFYYVSHWKL